jgi:hypothetical protein
MASALYRMNRANESLALQETVLAIRKRVLGPEHPTTLATMYNLDRQITIDWP